MGRRFKPREDSAITLRGLPFWHRARCKKCSLPATSLVEHDGKVLAEYCSEHSMMGFNEALRDAALQSATEAE